MADERVLRSMLPGESGVRPLVGDRAMALGIRPGKDIPVAEDGIVTPGTGGMSVSPQIKVLPYHRIPKQFRSVSRKAEGSERLICWCLRNADWKEGPIRAELLLRIDKPKHGQIEPSQAMPIDLLRTLLTGTAGDWDQIPWDELDIA